MPQIRSFHGVFLLYLLKVSVYILTVIATEEHVTPNGNLNPGDPLYLTPLIERGEISQAVEAALVKDIFPIVSYSGLITVNATFNSNIFFWFFPAEGKEMLDNDAPVILWNSRAHGVSCIFSIFNQNGPFEGSYDETNYTDNTFSWHKRFNMIYVDNTVESGFSFTENEGGYITSTQEAAKDTYAFLTQFFQLFPRLLKNHFYSAGEAYGSTYALQIANYIHEKNQEGNKTFIKLKGLILGSPWIDPYRQVEYGDYLFNVGLLSESSLDYFRERQAEIKYLIDKNFYQDAYLMFTEIINNDTLNMTGYEAIGNYVYEDSLPFVVMMQFITRNNTRKAIHVGSLKYNFVNTAQQERMKANVMRSSKSEMEILLQARYKFLLYVGNLDCRTGHLGIRKLIKSLCWDGATELLNGKRTIWLEDYDVAGYNMTNNNMTFLIVRNAGHWCLAEQPEWIFSAVQNFVY